MADKWTDPIFPTGIAAKALGVQPKTLINYDNWGLFSPERSVSGRRLYSRQDLYELMAIRHLIKDKNLSISGIKFVLELIQIAGDEGVNLVDKILPEDVKEEIEERIP